MKIRFFPAAALKAQGYNVENTEQGLKVHSGKPFYWGLYAPSPEALTVDHALQYLKLANRHYSTYLVTIPGLTAESLNEEASPKLLVVSSEVYAKLLNLDVKFEGVRRRLAA